MGVISWFGQRFSSGRRDSAGPLELVAKRQMSPRDYVIQFCDSQFTNEDFTETGNAFVDDYYIKHYFDDYRMVFEGSFPDDLSRR